MKRKSALLMMVLFVFSLLVAPFAAKAEPSPAASKEAVLKTIFAEISQELGGVPLTGFSAKDEDLDVEDDTLSFSGKFTKPGTMSDAELEQAKKHFISVIEKAYGVESYDIERDSDSLDATFEQTRSAVTVGDEVYGTQEYVPYVSVTISLTAEKGDTESQATENAKYSTDKAAATDNATTTDGGGYTTLEYDVDITLEEKVIRLELGQDRPRINGKPGATLDVAPFVEDGRTLVPLRFLGEQLGATFQWSEKNKEVSFAKGEVTVKVRLGDDEARVYIKGVPSKTVALDVPARVVQGRTVMPLRFISESFGAVVRWNPADRSIIVRR